MLHPVKSFKFPIHVLVISVTVRVLVASVVNLRQKESVMSLIRDKRFDTSVINGNQMCFLRGM